MRFAILVALIALVPASVAYGHGGITILDEAGNDYSARVLASNADEGIDLTTYLVRQDLGEPDASANVEITLGTPDGERTVTAKPVSGAYEAIVPGTGDEWRDWNVEVEISGVAGDATFSAEPTGESPVPVVTLALISAVLLLAGGGFVLRMRRRRNEETG